MERKIIIIGNSVGITLPKDLLNAFDLKVGDSFKLKVVEGGFLLTFKQDLMKSKALEKVVKE